MDISLLQSTASDSVANLGSTPGSNHHRWLNRRLLWIALAAIVAVYLLILGAEMFLRVVFPWDLLKWPESPFLTDMMKLNRHVPVYSHPADGNSFVYSPGLEYLTFALLKPFGLALDIRFCRLVNVLIGMLAAVPGVLVMRRLARSAVSQPVPRLVWFFSWCVMWLVISTNFVSDLPHPDNLHALLVLSVFWLCFTAVETKRFGWAMSTMAVAGIGVFTKQTGAICFLGPALVFAVLNPWGWRRWGALVAFGLTTLAISLYLLWLPEFGRLFTLDLLAHQKVETNKLLYMVVWLLGRRRSFLVCLTLLAAFGLWQANGSGRRYLICWSCIGFFAVGPNTMAFIKIAGLANNLCLFEIWMFVLIWPVIMLLPHLLPQHIRQFNRHRGMTRGIMAAPYAGVMIYVLWLFPHKEIPTAAEYDFCRQIEAAVRNDIRAGRKVLISQGTACLINCGVTEPPRDRCNSVLETLNGQRPDLLSGMKERIVTHYYDRVYLAVGGWYGPDLLNEIHRHYTVDAVIQRIDSPRGRLELNGATMHECTEYAILK